ncbi:recombinase [Lentzea atacamensis]|uniref:Recombinase n=1 Tax=Lentzea atacamensis TaxID=531938 RepID=A0A316HUH4_9PSEU|nr:recombinase [Lentzea atacamensis]
MEIRQLIPMLSHRIAWKVPRTQPGRGPIVKWIFEWRLEERLGYQPIADRLNRDLVTNPPPTPNTPSRAVGLWTYSNVRDILTNPKYAGHMMWNRRARKSVGNKRNPSPNGSGHPNPCTRYWSTSTPSSRPKKSAATASAPAPPTKPTPSTRSQTVGSAAPIGDILTCPTGWVPELVANWRLLREAVHCAPSVPRRVSGACRRAGPSWQRAEADRGGPRCPSGDVVEMGQAGPDRSRRDSRHSEQRVRRAARRTTADP